MREGTIRFVEDEDSSYWLLESTLKSLNIPYVGHRTAEELLDSVNDETTLIFMDMSLPGMSGIDCLQALRLKSSTTPVVVVSACDEQASISRAIQSGATWYIAKPFNLPDIQCAIENAALLKQQRQLVRSAATLCAEQDISASLEKIAQSACSVLIIGEHGTGKTTLARRVHDVSPRRNASFVSISCANIPKELFESELFGFEKGAFTGAASSKQGLVELADGGTLFLDEIGDLPSELQPKLLTFLQERRASRIGSRLARDVDTRIIAATNQDLRSLVKAGAFRADLYYRLNVVHFEVAPLRQRRSELPDLVEALCSKICTKNSLTPKPLSQAAEAALLTYPFPGNVRELENMLEHALILAEGPEILPTDLPFETNEEDGAWQTQEDPFASTTLGELEERAIRAALARHGGNRARAARDLGITERTLYNKLKVEIHNDLTCKITKSH